jgi:tetratricopeptide (TPR) repeat protein
MLGSLLALIHAHKQCLTIDKEAVTNLDQKLKEERKRSDDQALYHAGIFLLYVDKVDKAKEYVDRLLKINPLNKDGLILKGWVEVILERSVGPERSAGPGSGSFSRSEAFY